MLPAEGGTEDEENKRGVSNYLIVITYDTFARFFFDFQCVPHQNVARTLVLIAEDGKGNKNSPCDTVIHTYRTVRKRGRGI